jgi:hypothetical protein
MRGGQIKRGMATITHEKESDEVVGRATVPDAGHSETKILVGNGRAQ